MNSAPGPSRVPIYQLVPIAKLYRRRLLSAFELS